MINYHEYLKTVQKIKDEEENKGNPPPPLEQDGKKSRKSQIPPIPSPPPPAKIKRKSIIGYGSAYGRRDATQ